MTAEWLVRLHRDQPVVGSIPLLYESKQRSIHVRCRGAHGCAMFGLAEAKTGTKGFCGTAVLRSCGTMALYFVQGHTKVSKPHDLPLHEFAETS